MFEKKHHNYSYALVISELIKLAHRHNFSIKKIGEEKFEHIGMTYPLYRFTVNPRAPKKFCIIAGVHGYEIAGPLTIPHLFEFPKKYFKKEIAYYIYPILNPTSFDLDRRMDDDNRDLNCLNRRTLKSRNYREIQAFYNDIKKLRFDALISMHEDLDETNFYAYVFEKEKNPVYRQIVRSASRFTGVETKKMIYQSPSDGHGLVINVHDQAIEDRFFCMKQAKTSLTSETPGKLDISLRIKINSENIKIINRSILSRQSGLKK
ncbi:MAG: succinylglutamate desuccinylase/aspartoacylase family protein [Candidatus Falkowbacteria bacterium]